MEPDELNAIVSDAAAKAVQREESVAHVIKRIQVACTDTQGAFHAVVSAAISTGDLEFLQLVLDASGAGLHSRPFGAVGHLSAAVRSGSITMLDWLLSRGVGGDSTALNEALYVAADRGQAAMARLLIARGADVWPAAVRESARRTALMAACARDCVEVAKILLETRTGLERRQFASARTREGDTALACAGRSGSVSCAKLLLEVGCPADQPLGDAGEPLLVLAARHGREDLVRYLVYSGADADARGALAAAAGGHFRVALFLLERGADLLSRDAEGTTLRGVLKRTGVVDLIKHIHRAFKAPPAPRPAPRPAVDAEAEEDEDEDREVAAALGPASPARAALPPPAPPSPARRAAPSPAPPSPARRAAPSPPPSSSLARTAPAAVPHSPILAVSPPGPRGVPSPPPPPPPPPPAAPASPGSARERPASAPGGTPALAEAKRSLMEEIRTAGGRCRAPSPAAGTPPRPLPRRAAPPPLAVPGHGPEAEEPELSPFAQRRAYIGSCLEAGARRPPRSPRPSTSPARVHELGESLVRRLSTSAMLLDEPPEPPAAAPPPPAAAATATATSRRKSLAGAVRTPLMAAVHAAAPQEGDPPDALARTADSLPSRRSEHVYVLRPPPRPLRTASSKPSEDSFDEALEG